MSQPSLVQSAVRPWQFVCLIASVLTLIIAGLWYQSQLGAKRQIAELEESLESRQKEIQDVRGSMEGLQVLGREQEAALTTKTRSLEELRMDGRRRQTEADRKLEEEKALRAQVLDDLNTLKKEHSKLRRHAAHERIELQLSEAARGVLARRVEENANYAEVMLDDLALSGRQSQETEQLKRQFQARLVDADRVRIRQAERMEKLVSFEGRAKRELEELRKRDLEQRRDLEKHKKDLFEVRQRATAQRKKVAELFNETQSLEKSLRNARRASRRIMEHNRNELEALKAQYEARSEPTPAALATGDLQRKLISASADLKQSRQKQKAAEDRVIGLNRELAKLRAGQASTEDRNRALADELNKTRGELETQRRLAHEAAKDTEVLRRQLKSVQATLEKLRSKKSGVIL